MKKITWMAGGILFVSAVFFIPGEGGSLWSSILLSCTAAVIYLVALCAAWLKKIESKSTRNRIAWTIGALVVVSVISAFLSFRSSRHQIDLLTSFRGRTETSYLHSYINQSLLHTLQSRYSENPDGRYPTFAAAFHANYDSIITNNHELQFSRKDEIHTWHIYVAKAQADSVVLIGESRYIRGRNPGFRNFSGDKGWFQAEGILTEKGVRYEREN